MHPVGSYCTDICVSYLYCVSFLKFLNRKGFTVSNNNAEVHRPAILICNWYETPHEDIPVLRLNLNNTKQVVDTQSWKYNLYFRTDVQ